MKKFALPFAALALLVCLFATSAFANDVTYANGNVNLRTGPGTQYAVLTVVPSGAQVYVEQPDTGSGWTLVDYGNYTGYVSSYYLGANNTPAPAPAYSPSGNANFTPMTTTAGVNLRSGPGTQYPVWVVVPAGATVYVQDYANGWAHVSFANYDGYVSMQYINGLGGTVAPAAQTVPSTQPNYAGATTVYNGVDYARVYDYGYYLHYHRDVVNALGSDPKALLKHFVEHGMDEGRQACESFNPHSYKDQNPDLAARYNDNWRMYYLSYMGLV